MSKKLPAMPFYPGDWMKDPELRSVSSAARGLWIDMLCLMWESRRRGYLEIGSGRIVTTEMLARMTGNSLDETTAMIQELDDSGVFSRLDHGVIYSRRMVKDERIRSARSDAGKKGGEARKGDLSKQNSKQKGGKSKASGKQKRGSSVSSSISVSTSVEEPPTPFDFEGVEFPDGMDTSEVRQAIRDWLEYKRKRKEPYKDPADQITRLLRLPKFGGDPGVFVASVDLSIVSEWQGVHVGDGGKLATGPPAKPASRPTIPF